MNHSDRLWHSWLHIERLTRVAVAARLRLLNDDSDRTLAAVLVESDYRGYRMEVNAELADGFWNAQVRITRIFSEEKPHVEVVTCRK